MVSMLEAIALRLAQNRKRILLAVVLLSML
jgi:hypothetical protein